MGRQGCNPGNLTRKPVFVTAFILLQTLRVILTLKKDAVFLNHFNAILYLGFKMFSEKNHAIIGGNSCTLHFSFVVWITERSVEIKLFILFSEELSKWLFAKQ